MVVFGAIDFGLFVCDFKRSREMPVAPNCVLGESLQFRQCLLLRRKAGGAAPAEVLPKAFGVLRVDPSKFEVTVGKKEIVLTATEFKLLEYLLATRGRVATRESLLDRVWGYDSAITTRTVDTHIKRLREKLGQASAYIETIRGVGYRFLEHPDKR